MPNYDFTKDFPIARETEKEIAQKLQEFYGWKVLEVGKTNAFDLRMQSLSGKIFTIEIKEDFTCYKTGNIGVEFECRGKQSGIAVTKSDYYLYKVHTPLEGRIEYCWIRTSKLKRIIEDETIDREIKLNCGDRNSNTKNYLFRYYGTFVPQSIKLFEETKQM